MNWYIIIGLLTFGCCLRVGIDLVRNDDDLDRFDTAFHAFLVVMVSALAIGLWPLYVAIGLVYYAMRRGRGT